MSTKKQLVLCAGSVGSGILLSLAVNDPGVFFLFAMAGLIPLFLSLISCAKSRHIGTAFPLGTLFGFAYTIGSYFWMWSLASADLIPAGKLTRIALISSAVFVPSLAAGLLFGLWALFCTFILVKTPDPRRWYVFPLCAGLGFLLIEWAQTATVSSLPVMGLPWVRIALSLTETPVLLQSAALWGSLGLGGCLVFLNALLAWAVADGTVLPQRLYAAGLAALLLFAGLGAGELRMSLDKPALSVSAALVQGNLETGIKWSADGATDAKDRYFSLTKDAPSHDLTVWTESAIPLSIDLYPDLDRELRELAFSEDTTIVTGLFHRTDDAVYNSVYAYDPAMKRTDEPYSKQYPVPFGEFLPFSAFFEKNFPTLAALNQADPITPGTSSEPLAADVGNLGALVCFDCAYPEVARKETQNGAELLLILSNSSWFSDPAASRQALGHAVLRAAECSRDTLLSSSRGISAAIDAHGEILAESGLFETGVLSADVSRRFETTPFVVFSESGIGIAAFVILLLLTLSSLLSKPAKKEKKKKRGQTKKGSS